MLENMYGININKNFLNSMNKLIVMAVCCAALFAGACSKNEPQTTPQERPILIKTGISEVTRAPQLNGTGSGNFTTGDCFTLHVWEEPHSPGAKIVDYTVGTTQIFWRDLAFGESAQVTFAACYPRQELVDGRFVFNLEQAEERDLLLASTAGVAAGTTPEVALTFRHAMHRLVVNCTVEDPASSLAAEEIELSCRAKSTCTVDLTTGTLDTTEAGSATFTAQGASGVFLIVPQDPADVELEVRVGTLSKRYTLAELDPECDTLAGGKQLSVNLTIKDGSIHFDGAAIEGWGDQGTIEDEIIM